MIKIILNGILSVVLYLVNLLLVPIDNLILQYLPGLSTAFNLINSFIDKLIEYVSFVISYTGLNSTVILIIIDIYVFVYTVPLIIHGTKLAIKWFKTLRG